MIPADLGAEIARAIGAAVDAGVWPAAAGRVTADGTWRPPPDGAAGRYATTLPFELGPLTGESPAAVAGRLAGPVSGADWVGSAEATGDGYLTITVSPAALAGVAVRVARAGPECARSDALRGVRRAGPPLPDLAAAPGWRAAWQDQAAALTGRLAETAGATVTPPDATVPPQPDRWQPDRSRHGHAPAGQDERAGPPPGVPGHAPSAGRPGQSERPAPGESAGPGDPAGPLAEAVGYAGADAVRYWLARTRAGPAGPPASPSASRAGPPASPSASPPGPPPGPSASPPGPPASPSASSASPPAPSWPATPAAGFPVTHDLGDPWYAVSFAHADAASVLRWARELGAARPEPDERLAGLLGEPAELALLTGLSWLGERVAGAARRAEPAELPRYLEELAAGWLTCRETCPALPFGGRAAPRDPAGISARLWLAAATETALAAGLRLIGVAARERL